MNLSLVNGIDDHLKTEAGESTETGSIICGRDVTVSDVFRQIYLAQQNSKRTIHWRSMRRALSRMQV